MIKYDVRHFNKLLAVIRDGNIRFLLLYGNDLSYMNLLCKHLAIELNLVVQVFNHKELSSLSLTQILLNREIAAESKMIQIRDVQDLKQYLKVLGAVSSEHLVVFWDGAHDKKNQLLFDKCGNEFAAVSCYRDSVEDVKKIILNRYQLRIDQEQLDYLTQRLYGKEHQRILDELDQLSLYQQSGNTLDAEVIAQAVHEAAHAQGYEMCLAFVLKQYSVFFHQIDMLRIKGIGDFLVLRALINFYLNILQMKKYGLALDFKPPVPSYLRRRVANAVDAMCMRLIEKTLNDLRIAEVQLKRSVTSFNLAAIICK